MERLPDIPSEEGDPSAAVKPEELPVTTTQRAEFAALARGRITAPPDLMVEDRRPALLRMGRVLDAAHYEPVVHIEAENVYHLPNGLDVVCYDTDGDLVVEVVSVVEHDSDPRFAKVTTDLYGADNDGKGWYKQTVSYEEAGTGQPDFMLRDSDGTYVDVSEPEEFQDILRQRHWLEVQDVLAQCTPDRQIK